MAVNVARDLEGTWAAVSSENIDAYLIALGVGKCERQKIEKDQIWQRIQVIDDVIHLEMCHSGSRQIKLQFKLNETFEIRAGKCSKAQAAWRDGALTIQCVRVDTGLEQTIERRRVRDKMIQTMTHKDVTCSRTFERTKDTDLD